MPLSDTYEWLSMEPGPKMLQVALKLMDIVEFSGEPDNPVILAWAGEVGGKVKSFYTKDSIPWCGLFMAVVAQRGAKTLPVDPLWALNWATFGTAAKQPMLGDVLVFVRRTPDGRKAGHVALYVGEDDTCYHILGGNQADKVCIVRKEKSLLHAARRPNYKAQPANVRRVVLEASGGVSTNEQ
ncbi:MAG: hypothetical protein RL173_418 [Fibrobacterota bacterium]|jgi:uncharacterized protein (TIGR02594 family)